MSDEVYLEIEPEVFESLKMQSKKNFKKEFPNDEREAYWFPDLDFDCSEDEWKNGILTLGGIMKVKDKHLGYVSVKIKMDTNRVLAIINDYMKRLGKVKTILEATKSED